MSAAGKVTLASATYRGTLLSALMGDLTHQNVDAIVNPANSALIMGGGVAGSIKRAGGKEIEEEAIRYAPVAVGQAIKTRAGKLPAKYVMHSPTMPSPAMLTDKAAVQRATQAALKLANDMHLRTIAFPGMGTGVGGVSPQVAAGAMIDEIKRLIDNGTSLEEIIFVCRDEELLQAFDGTISKLIQK